MNGPDLRMMNEVVQNISMNTVVVEDININEDYGNGDAETVINFNNLEDIIPLFDFKKNNNLRLWINVIKLIYKWYNITFKTNKKVNGLNILLKCEQLAYLGNIYQYCKDGNGKLSKIERELINKFHLHYLTKKQLVCSQTRVENDEHTKYKIFLPKESSLAKLLILSIHEINNHASHSTVLSHYKENYSTNGIRSVSKKVISGCITCRRLKTRLPTRPPLPHLPEDRTNFRRPFEAIGIDTTGHFWVTEFGEERKVYIYVATCMSTRAIFLEVIEDLTAEATLMFLRRLGANYGPPKTIYSDNATSFHATQELLRQHIDKNDISWHFQTPRAPWKGGHFERLIGIVKSTISTTIAKKKLKKSELQTIIKEAECLINTRPLTYIEDDINQEIITPSKLIRGYDVYFSSLYNVENSEDIDFTLSENKLKNHYFELLRILKKFTNLFKKQYLNSLSVTRNINRKYRKWSPKVGDVVLIKNEGHRELWPLGRIIAIYDDDDNFVRSVKVSDGNKEILRDPSLLVPLITNEGTELDNSLMRNNESETVHNDNIDNEAYIPNNFDIENTTSVRGKRKAAQKQKQLIKTLISDDVL